jgi:glycosyltransferase involved in cell wall biosynthesis
MKKILQIIPHLNLGGAEVMCKHLSVALKKAGHDVTVVSFYDVHSQNTSDLEAAGIQVIYLSKKGGFDFSVLTKLRKIIKEYSPDVIHTHLAAIKYAFIASIGLKKHIVHTIHSVAQQECGRFSRILNKIFLKTKRVTFVGLSEIIGQTIHEVYHLPQKEIPVVFNGVRLENCTVKTDWTLHDPVSIAHVAGFRPVKNHTELIGAVKLLKERGYNVKLSLYGDGEERARIEQCIVQNQLQESVILYGFCDNVAPYLHESDLFVLPSLYEGISLSIAEAMGTGLPVVASNVGGNPDMITDGEDGLLCEPVAESIAAKIAMLIDDDDLRSRLGKKATQSVERFSAASMLDGYLKIYQETK